MLKSNELIKEIVKKDSIEEASGFAEMELAKGVPSYCYSYQFPVLQQFFAKELGIAVPITRESLAKLLAIQLHCRGSETRKVFFSSIRKIDIKTTLILERGIKERLERRLDKLKEAFKMKFQKTLFAILKEKIEALQLKDFVEAARKISTSSVYFESFWENAGLEALWKFQDIRERLAKLIVMFFKIQRAAYPQLPYMGALKAIEKDDLKKLKRYKNDYRRWISTFEDKYQQGICFFQTKKDPGRISFYSPELEAFRIIWLPKLDGSWNDAKTQKGILKSELINAGIRFGIARQSILVHPCEMDEARKVLQPFRILDKLVKEGRRDNDEQS